MNARGHRGGAAGGTVCRGCDWGGGGVKLGVVGGGGKRTKFTTNEN